jgi:hypothetical protein
LSILDGGGQYRVISLLSSSPANPTGSLILEDVTIQNGLAQGGTGSNHLSTSGYGGGLFVQNAPINMNNIIVKNNRAIGGNNSSNAEGGVGVGGGMAVNGLQTGSIIMNHVTFDSNISLGGNVKDRGAYSFAGGLYTYATRIDIIDMILNNNLTQAGSTSTGSGSDSNGTADALGGGASFHFGSNATVRNLIVTNNRAIGGNAVVRGGNAFGGGLFAESASILTITDAEIRGNTTTAGNAQNGGLGGGGGLMATDTWLTLERAVVIANSAKGGIGSASKGPVGGGGLYLTQFLSNISKTKTIVVNSVIADNLIEHNTGTGNPGGGGGGLWIQGVDVEINHSTIDNNRMQSSLVYGSAAIVVNFSTPYPSNVNLNYTTVTNHVSSPGTTQSTLHIWSGNKLTLNKGLFWGNSNDTNAENDPASSGGPGNIVGLASMITGKAVNYIAAIAPYYNYHLALNSNAKDQASGSQTQQDIDFEHRPYGSVADIGMDEYTPFLITVVPFDGGLHVEWSAAANTILAGGVEHFSITVTCAPGANPPNGIPCNAPANLGSSTNITLSGLTNFKSYTIAITAYNGNEIKVFDSQQVSAAPTNLFIYLPLIQR